MLPPPDAALAHYSDRQSLVTASAEVAGQMWSNVDPARIVESWTTQVPELTVVLSGAQYGAAKSADPYLDEVAAWQELDAETASPIDPRAFAGAASDGRSLASLLMSPAFSALQAIASGLGTLQSLSLGRQHLDTIARTQVADAGRIADGVALAARGGLDGYQRVVVGKTCSRCMLLAGKKYRWNEGFDRHPRCDCVHLPCKLAEHLQVVQDPRAIYDSMSTRERQRAGWSLADQQAIADGADLAQVTNAHRGVYTAGGRKYTTQGTTKRGFAGARLKGARRLTPEQIYAEAADRDEALRLLYDHGYLVNEPAVVRRSDLILAAAKPSPAASAGKRAASAVVTIRPELEAARTPYAVSQAFRREYTRVTGRYVGAVDFRGSAATAREHAEGLLRGLERFPDTKLRDIYTFEQAGNNSYAHAVAGQVEFNYRWTSPAARREYLASAHSDVEAGWHPRGADSPVAIAVHEFGHVLDLHTLGDNIGGDVYYLIKRRVAEAGPLSAEDYVKFGSAEDALISREISGYATSHRHELIAEAFSDVMINGAEASRLSHEIFGLLEAEYRKGGLRVGVEVLAASGPASDISKLTIPKLRELAKERGIKVPSRALKADIVALLDGGATRATPLTGAAKRAATRARAAEIERRTQVGDLLAELDSLIAKKADAAVFGQRLDHAATTGVDAGTVAALRRAVEAGDATKLRAAMTRIGTKNGLKPVGRAGQKVKFDETLHEALGDMPPPGTQVLVVRRGTSLTLDGETIPLDKAKVTTAVVPKLAATVTPAEARKMMEFAAAVEAMILNDALKAGVGDLILHRVATDLGIAATSRDAVIKALLTGSPEKTRAAMAEAFRAAGVKTAVGKPGTVVKFDPKIHAAPGRAKIAPGTKVRMAEPGLLIEHQGKTVILSKSRIEPMGSTARTLPPEIERVADLSRTAEVGRRPLGGGMTGQVDLVTYQGGRVLVRKELGRRAEDVRSVVEMMDAEELAPMVYQALGVRVPATYRATDRVLYMSHVEGKTGEEIVGWGQVMGPDLLDSDQGRMMGLGDYLTQDTDRNMGGFIIDSDQNMWSLDHGFAFQRNTEGMVGGPHEFAGHFDGRHNDMTPGDMAAITARLEGLRGEFERTGRLSWWRAMMKRMDIVQRGATGTRSRL